MSRANLAQKFFDAIADSGMFCEGLIPRWVAGHVDDISFTPNCGVRDRCPLFRDGPSHGLIKRWGPGFEHDPTEGCQEFRAMLHWLESQKEWVIKFDGHDAQQVCGRNPFSAACAAWLELVRNGQSQDEWLLLERRYRIREA